METKNSNSNKVIENVFPLLKSDFIVARRAYWFLMKNNLNNEQRSILEKFGKTNKTSL